MSTRRLRVVWILTLAGVVWLGCRRQGSPEWPRDDTLVVALENAPTNLDPRLGTDAASEHLYQLFLSGLLEKGAEGELLPDLATDWEVLDGGLRYRFYLDMDREFHDGRAVTARDVAFTFNTLVDGTVATPKKGAFGPLDRVEAVDEYTVDFHLAEPWGSLLVNLTSGQGILPHGTTPPEMNEDPVGTGPFRVVGRDVDSVTLRAWQGAPGKPPPMDRIVLRAVPDATVRALELEKGSVQLVVNALAPDVVALFRERPHFRVEQSPGANFAYLGFNLEDPILRRRTVRRALAHAIDRELIAEALWRGQVRPTETLVPPGHWARHEDLEPIPFSPPRARRLLDEAGFPDPPGPAPRFRLLYKTSTNETSRLQAQTIQAMLGDVGIEVEVRTYEFATVYHDIKQGSFQLYSLVWTGISDPDIYRYILHSDAVPPAGANRNRYRNPVFDRLVDEAGRRFARRQRRPLYLRAQEILHRDLPYLSLYVKDTVAVMAEALSGYRNYPSGELTSLREVRWDRN